MKASIFGIVLDFIYGEIITVNDWQEGLEILGVPHRYGMEELQSYVADLLCSFKVLDSKYRRILMNEVHKPQNITLKSKLFSALAKCERWMDTFFICTDILDVLEEVKKLPTLRCQGEMEILDRVLRFFSSIFCDVDDNQDQKARILSCMGMEKMDNSNLRDAIKICNRFPSESAVIEFRVMCV